MKAWKLLGLAGLLALAAPFALRAQQPAASSDVTFTKDIAPILQRSCQNCHRPTASRRCRSSPTRTCGRTRAPSRQRTGIGPRAGVMPPWYVEKNIGIQHYKNDPSLSDVEIAKIARWADGGAPRGNPADMPPAIRFEDDRRLDDRPAGPRHVHDRTSSSRRTRPTGGAKSRACRSPASPKTATSPRWRSAKSTTSRRMAAAARPSAATTSSIT